MTSDLALPPRGADAVRPWIETARLALLIAGLVLAALAYTDQVSARPPWWRWSLELAAGWGAIILAIRAPVRPRESPLRRLIRYLAGGTAVLAGGLALQWLPIAGHELPTGVAVVAALATFAVARWVPFAPSEVRIVVGDLPSETATHPAWSWARALLGAAAIGAALSATVLNHDHHIAGFVLWLTSLVGFVAALWQSTPAEGAAHAPRPPNDGGPAPSPRVQALLLALILLLALALRVPLLNEVPWSIDGDEGRQGRHAELIWQTGFPDAFDLGWNVFPHLSFMAEYVGVQAFGTSNANLRLSAAVIGTLSLVPLFFWARRWWGGAIALLATLLMAINREHIGWSRINFNNIHQVLVAALMLATFARALRTRRWVDWAWVGYATGLGFHTYHAAKLFPALLAAASTLLVLGIHGLGRRHLSGVIVGAVACVLCWGPLVVSTYERWDAFYPSVSNRGDVDHLVAAYREGNTPVVRAHLLSHVVGCLSAFTTVPRLRDAIFDPFVAVPFWLGVGWMCWRWRDPRHLVVLAWAIGILVIGGMMTDYPPSKARMLGLLPAVCVIPAVVAGQLRAQLARLLPRRGDYLVVPLLLVWLASAAEFNWRSEFVMRPAEQRGLDPMTELYRAVTRTSLPATFYLARGADLPTVAQALRDCMAPRNPDRHVVELPVDASVVPIPPSNVGNAVLLIAGPAEDLAPLVEHYYPDATHEIIRDPNWGSVVLHIFRLPSAALDRHRGLQGIGDAADPRGGTTRLEPPEDAPLPVTATWAGLIWLPETAHYAFRADPGRVRVDTTWFSDNAPARELTAGWHEIEVQVTFTSRAAPAVLSWKRPGSAAWRDVPREFLNTHPALHGLLGRYYGSDQPDRGPRPLDAPPDNQHIETALSFDWQPGSDDPAPGYFAARPSTMEWLGTVELAEGEPVLRLEATTPTQVFVDGALVASTLGGRTAPPVEVHLAGVRGPATLLVRTRRSADDNWFFWKLKLLWKQPGGTWSAFARYAPPGAPRSPDGS